MVTRILRGDCLERLRELPDNSVHAIVTDPPAGVSFMGAAWDHDKGGRLAWIAWLASVFREAYRVARPGAHAVVWALPRTSHWTATALEDAGFEIRDSLHHVFGSGFPKSLDVARAVDKVDGVAMTREATLRFTHWLRGTGITAAQVNEATQSFMASHYLSANEQPAIPTPDMMDRIRPLLAALGAEVPLWVEELVEARRVGSENEKKRPVVGERVAADFLTSRPVSVAAQGLERVGRRVIVDTSAYTDEAKRWEGWKTALKPAHEVWWLARKPLDGSVAANVLRWGCGALNVEGTRVEYVGDDDKPPAVYGGAKGASGIYSGSEKYESTPSDAGRYPANLLLTHSATCADDCAADCPVAELDRQSGESQSQTGPQAIERKTPSNALKSGMGKPGSVFTFEGYGDAGGASRFFPVFRYEPKPSREERDRGCEALPLGRGGPETFDPEERDGTGERRQPRRRNTHPTVKPVALMAWLVTLVTPKGGVVLDPFLGSGTTAIAAARAGVACIGCEAEEEFVRIAAARLAGDSPLFAQVSIE